MKKFLLILCGLALLVSPFIVQRIYGGILGDEPFFLKHWELFRDCFGGIAAVWVVFLYFEDKDKDRKEMTKASAEKLHQLFSSFYLNKDFDDLRIWLDYDPDYQEQIEPALKKVLNNDPTDKPDKNEKERLCKLDKALNYFEFILHLEKKNQLDKDDRDAIFKYWLDLIKRPEREALQKYIGQYG